MTAPPVNSHDAVNTQVILLAWNSPEGIRGPSCGLLWPERKHPENCG